MVNVDYGKGPLTNLRGMSSNGPVAIFNDTSTTIVVSPAGKFDAAVVVLGLCQNAFLLLSKVFISAHLGRVIFELWTRVPV